MAAKPPGAPPQQTVDVEILRSVYDAAREVAIQRGDQVAQVGRQILRSVHEPRCQFMLKHLPEADRGAEPRKNFRFGMPVAHYEAAKEIVVGEGKSVARWVEYGLERYANPDAPGKL